MSQNLGRARRLLSISLAALIVAWAPGLSAYQAAAATVESGGNTAPIAAPVALPALNLPAAPAVQAPGEAVAAVVPAQISQAAVPAAEVVSAAAPAARQVLAAGAARIAKAQSAGGSGVRGALERLFGGRAQAGATSGGDVSGGSSFSGNDFTSPALASYGETRRDLSLIAAQTGIVASLPAVSAELKGELLSQAAGKKIVFSDYDDTLDKHMGIASPGTVAAILAVKKAGKQVVVLTDRPDQIKESAAKAGVKKEDSILESLSSIPADQRAGIIVASNKGGRILQYDAAGEAKLIYEEPKMSDEEHQKIAEAAAVVKGELAALGTALHDGSRNIPAEGFHDYSYGMMLKIGTPEAAVRAVGKRLQAELDARGINETVIPRFPKDAANPPYVTFSHLSKAVGVRRVAEILKIQAKDALILGDSMYVPAWTKPSNVPAEAAAAAKRQGIDLETPLASSITGNDADRDMERALPGALTLSVGGTADPRMANGYVMPGKGPEVTREILKALASMPLRGDVAPPAPKSAADEPINKRALIGLFAQRSIGIVAFIAITIAYPFAAMPVVGAHGLGILMSFSPAMGLIAGPVSGIMIDKLSPRNAMILNTVARGALLMMLPAFHYFGILNFWTLLVAALADGFLLSSIMTTEGGSLKKIFPGKSLGPINSGLFISYLGLQVLFGLVLLLGSVVDKFNPFNVFAVGAAVNFLLVLPIVWATIPNTAPAKKAAAAQNGPKKGKLDFLKRYWKEALLTVATIAAFPLVHTSLPISAALLYWIARTDGFKAMWNGSAVEPSKEAAALSARKTQLEAAVAAGDAAKQAELDSVNSDLKRESGRLRSAMLIMALGAMMMYPLQYFGLPLVAQALAGVSGKGLLLGQLLGSLFFGNLVSTAAQAKLPEVKLPFLKKPVAGQRLIQVAVLGLAAAWVFTRLVPGSLLATAAAVAVAAGLMALSQKLTARGWIALRGVGFVAIWLPFAVWAWPALIPFLTVKTAMFASLIAIGMFYGAGFVAATTYFMANSKKDQMGTMTGIQGSFFNAAISFGYGLLTLASGFVHPAFPALLGVLGVAYLAAGAVHARWPKLMPGLPKDLFFSGSAAVNNRLSYGLRRAVIAAVATGFGINYSLPQAGEGLTARLLKAAASKKIVIADLDDTLVPHNGIISPEMAASIVALRKAGKRFAVVTVRPSLNPRPTDVTVQKSLSTIAPQDRAGIIAASLQDGYILEFDANGEPQPVYQVPPFSESESQAIHEAAAAVGGKLAALGTQKEVEHFDPLKYVLILKAGTPSSAVIAVGAELQKELAQRGIGYQVEPRMAKDPAKPPYVVFSKIDKARLIQELAQLKGVTAEDAVILGDSMYKPESGEKAGLLARLLGRVAAWLSGLPMPATGNADDASMETPLPGALTFSVGGSADARLRNGWVLAGKGPDVSRRVINAMAAGQSR